MLVQAVPPVPPPAPALPLRQVPDSGVIATSAQITPAGVQSVFAARVTGVRFGARPGEIWVAANWAAYRLSWRDNAMLASVRIEGRAGVHGVAIDPVNGRAVVSTVGKTFAYDDSAIARWASPKLGDEMAGGVAVARRANASGHRVAVVPLPANDALAVLDADDGSLLKTVALGVLPVAAAISADGSTAWVSNLGGSKATARSRAAKQCCDAFAELVRVDARGIADVGNVTEVDLVAGNVRTVTSVGRHPTGVAWDEKNGRLYVANGNSDTITVIDTRRRTTRPRAIAIAPFRERKIGYAPTAVALSPDGGTLYVALGGLNAVAVYAVPSGRFRGLIPTGWYPSSIDVSADGSTIAVGTLFGVGSGSGRTSGMSGRYVHSYRGSVNVIAVPTDAELLAYTTSVARNNRLTLRGEGGGLDMAPRRKVVARAVPERPGEPSLIEHVVYIIRENRTYDQVFGDMGRGASDSSLVQYGRDVTPNTHALADRYVLLDHFFASGGNSADGHNWLTQANETEYPMWPLYEGRSYPSEGQDPLAYSAGGFLWEAAHAKGRSVRVFGEYAPGPPTDSATTRTAMLARYRDSLPQTDFRALFAQRYRSRSDIASLDRILVREYPGWTMEVPDVAKAEVFLQHLREWEVRNDMPNLVMMNLPSNHTAGTSAGWCTPKACVADNDLALGKIVEGLSRSRFWKSMAILIVEDDAQNGVDHIDGHRTVALVASPYARRGVIDPTFYAFPSMLKTIELMLGLPALSMFDLVATDMRASFIGPDDAPDVAPYTALVPKQSLYEVNQQVGAITGPHAAERRRAARASARMKFDAPDAAPSDLLNRILWHDARGWGTPFPGVKRSLFFPMAVDLEDDEREERRADP